MNYLKEMKQYLVSDSIMIEFVGNMGLYFGTSQKLV